MKFVVEIIGMVGKIRTGRLEFKFRHLLAVMKRVNLLDNIAYLDLYRSISRSRV